MRVIESIADLAQEIKTTRNTVITVKSRIFFEIIENIKFNLSKHFRLPYPPTQIGSTTVFEATLLAAIINIFDYKKIVEIGTYVGFSTSVMALNSSSDAMIYTIDLPDSNLVANSSEYDRQALLADWKRNDDFLRHHQKSVGAYFIEQIDPDVREKVHMIKCDSTNLNEEILHTINGADMFFIDGGHAFEIISCDTDTALRSLKKNGWVVWHDYKSKTHTEVTRYIDNDFSKNQLVLHIENTMLALHAPNLEEIIGKFLR
jgi:hypothetical protein